MSYNSSNISYYILPETVEGVTPETGTALKLAHTPGSGPSYTKETVSSSALYAKRQSGGVRTMGGSVSGSFDFELKRSPAIDILLASALSGQWSGNVLQAGDQDSSFSILKTTGDADDLFHCYTGVQASELSLTTETVAMVEASTTLIGMNYVDPIAYEPGEALVFQEDAGGFPLAAIDVTASIAALPSIDVRSATLTVSHEREAKAALGPVSTIGVGTSGARTATLEVTFYRRDFAPETALVNDATTSVALTIGSGADGYVINMPAAQASWPEESVDGASVLVTMTFTAKVNAQGDIKITKAA
ncbi:hypothetical protein BRX37_21365 [Sphingomonas sp. S-NIH.Pt3_0716]|nr:hypothetical protein BRX37_21365 [Sphingomonas sp. S-NIH.Pt3_0716]